MMRETTHIKKIIIKVGSSSLCDQDGNIDQERVLQLILQIVSLKRKGYIIVVVSSGAIAAGMAAMHLHSKPRSLEKKQALAAIGQAHLMQVYESLFNLFNLQCAQILLNHEDFDDRHRLNNLFNTLEALLAYQVIPIINENDALATDEIKVGDNDTLASLLVPVVGADLLVLMSDIDGLYDDHPKRNPQAHKIDFVEHVDRTIEAMAKEAGSSLGTGGMMTKIKAAKIANAYGCDMAIIDHRLTDGLTKLLDGQNVGTWFSGKNKTTLSARQHWMLYRSQAKGKIMVDQGAKEALCQHRKSLLPKGILEVDSHFIKVL